MQGTKIRLIVGGLLMIAASSQLQAETLQPDPAWQQGKLDNGFSWQVLSTPQRPTDRIELRLLVNTGSLVESAQQAGFAHLLPRLALAHSASFTGPQLRSLWQQAVDTERPLPPAISSYDYTLYNLSLPTNRPDLLKEALSWLSDTTGNLALDERSLHNALNMNADVIGVFPPNTQDPWWRYRLKGSTLLGHDPAQTVKRPVQLEQLKQFYHQWYTPDVMTLYVVGNVDSRNLGEQINKAFSGLSGKRDAPATMPTLSPLSPLPVALISEQGTQDSLSLMWDNPWQPIRDSQSLSRYWRSDVAREALFLHLQNAIKNSDQQNSLQLGFDCRVQYQRAQCAIHMNTPNANLQPGMTFVARELVNLRNNGISQQEFDSLLAQKNDQLSKLFATYARTDTDVLMSQRLRSQQSGVVDIAPEQYQKLRQQFLSTLTVVDLNQELKQQLSPEATLILAQPKGEPEVNIKELQETYSHIMQPLPVAGESEESKPADPLTTENKPQEPTH